MHWFDLFNQNNQPRREELGMYKTRTSLNDKPVKYFHVSAHNTVYPNLNQ